MVSLVDYVERVYTIEKNLYEQKQFYHGLKQLKSSVSNSGLEYEICAGDYNDSRYSKICNRVPDHSDSALIWGPLSGIATLAIVYMIFKGIGGFLFGAFIGFLMGMAVSELVVISQNEKVNDKIERLLDEENRKIAQRNNTRAEAIAKKVRALDSEISIISKGISHTAKLLEEYYGINVIYPKYRNLAAMASICEYLKSGRCSKLEGADGAYNLYELELRQGIIIGKLDIIIKQLNRIEENQYLLYNAIVSADNNTRRLMSQVDGAITSLTEIKDNSTISAYNSAIIARNSQYQSGLMTYRMLTGIEKSIAL